MPDPSTIAADASPLFTFVVVADTHVNEEERMSTSPYETNHLSNPRARHVFTEIAAMDPAPRFVVHLGDIDLLQRVGNAGHGIGLRRGVLGGPKTEIVKIGVHERPPARHGQTHPFDQDMIGPIFFRQIGPTHHGRGRTISRRAAVVQPKRIGHNRCRQNGFRGDFLDAVDVIFPQIDR